MIAPKAFNGKPLGFVGAYRLDAVMGVDRRSRPRRHSAAVGYRSGVIVNSIPATSAAAPKISERKENRRVPGISIGRIHVFDAAPEIAEQMEVIIDVVSGAHSEA
jgi:hypothetical protein